VRSPQGVNPPSVTVTKRGETARALATAEDQALLALGDNERAVGAFDQYLNEGRYRYAVSVSGAFAFGSNGSINALPPLLFEPVPRSQGRREAEAYTGRALAQTRLGKYILAVRDYSQALAIEPKDWRVYGQRGRVYLVLESHELALEDFNQGIRLNPREGSMYTGRGFANVQLGRLSRPTADAEQALALGPLTPSLRLEAARIFAQAVAQIDATPKPRDQMIERQRVTYVERALSLIREAVEAFPGKDGSKFWQESIQQDRALDPVRGHADYARMAARYGK
jgi:tetratricopeptide (TPR) repeat protein